MVRVLINIFLISSVLSATTELQTVGVGYPNTTTVSLFLLRAGIITLTLIMSPLL